MIQSETTGTGLPGRLSFGWCCLVVSVVSLCVAPFFKEDFDVINCWLTWSVASQGLKPWAIYAANSDCNYPPFVLYLLTACQAGINVLHAAQTSPLAILIVKLPNILACLIGSQICVIGLKPLMGPKPALAVGVVYVLCLPLWFNAAIWGQWDALSALAMVTALLAVANERPGWAGSAIGWALSIKLHAIVILPAICIYTVRRWSIAQCLKSVAAALALWAIISVPFFIAGKGLAATQSYTGAINFYPGLSEGAFNGWQLLHFYNLVVRHQPGDLAGFDGQKIIGGITARQIGLLLFAIYTLWLSIGLLRNPTHRNLLTSAGLTAVAFFMLPTQVHQRYLVPAAAILVLVACAGYGKTYLLVMLAALVNQWVVMYYESRVISGDIDDASRTAFMQIYCVLSVLNLVGFVWITWHHHQQLRRRSGMPPTQQVPNASTIANTSRT